MTCAFLEMSAKKELETEKDREELLVNMMVIWSVISIQSRLAVSETLQTRDGAGRRSRRAKDKRSDDWMAIPSR